MITVCIVDDLVVMRQSLKAVLDNTADIGCVGVFSNAEDFIEAYDSLRPDISIMDIDLPGISGIEAISRLKTDYPKAQFLVLTIFNDDEKIFKALKAGAGGYLLKKHIFETLVEGIVELYRNGAPMSPEIAKKVINYFSHGSEKNELPSLTDKEKKVLQFIVDGYLYKEIASALEVSIDAVKKHAHNIYEKMQVRSRSEAIRKFYDR